MATTRNEITILTTRLCIALICREDETAEKIAGRSNEYPTMESDEAKQGLPPSRKPLSGSGENLASVEPSVLRVNCGSPDVSQVEKGMHKKSAKGVKTNAKRDDIWAASRQTELAGA